MNFLNLIRAMRVEQPKISNVVNERVDENILEMAQKMRRAYWNVTTFGGASQMLRDEFQILIENIIDIIYNYEPSDVHVDFAHYLQVLCKISAIRELARVLHEELTEACEIAGGIEYRKAVYGKRLCLELIQDL